MCTELFINKNKYYQDEKYYEFYIDFDSGC